jgi:hypothetical protein
MKFLWTDGPKVYRCMLDKPVQMILRGLSSEHHAQYVVDMGYIMFDGQFLANVYGSVDPEIPGKYFDNIDEAKAYVEEHALAGIAINKLTR